jgi:phenylpropionate dioxygenase-like ring-hydroxylating dioxygenase large terminal subunit
MNYLAGHWYVAAFVHEITTQPIRRVLFDLPIVLYRTHDGQAVALSDVCPHRRAPLHLGRVIGNEIACPYHGLRFEPSGKCSHNPNFRDPTPNVRARRYAVVERYNMVWIWMGEADSATPTTIPDFNRIAAPDVKPVHGYLRINAREPLISDNLLDLSHTEFLHPYLANDGFNSRLQQDMRQDGDTVFSLYSIANEPMTPLLAQLWDKDPITHADMRFHMRWEPPSCLLLEVGAAAPGRAGAEGVTAYVSHLLTPESATATHYFWTFARDSRKGDQQFDAHLQASISQAFLDEDAPIIEWQERYEQLPDLKPPARQFLRGDAGGARARRVVEKLESGDDA